MDDESNKAVVVDGEAVWGYTGLSQIGNEKTADWLARTLAAGGSTENLNDQLLHLCDEASRAFSQMPFHGKYKRQAFQGVGWFETDQSNGALVPGVCIIQNALNVSTGEWLPVANDTFRIDVQIPVRMPKRYEMFSVGVNPSAGDIWTVSHFMKKVIQHRRSTPRTIIDGLVKTMRWLALKYPVIGPGIMIVSIPRKAVELFNVTNEPVIWLGPPEKDAPTFMYLTATGQVKYFGPHFVMGGAVIPYFESSGLNHSVGVGFKRKKKEGDT